MTDAATTDFATRTNRSQRAITVDNFMRKALRISDPRNPDQIANALLSRYPDEADRDRREREGLPYSSAGNFRPVVSVAAGAGSIELETARSDLERDLTTISTLSQLKDITVEMNGWGRAIRQAASDGIASARLALDSVNRDTALSARRTLSEYARLARFVGAMSDGSGLYFRRLAQSCDVLGALILVAIGEGLAASGITRSTAMVRVAAGELQARRNAVVVALRSLTGNFDAVVSQDEYPRGILGYQTLRRSLESGGQAELIALLEENALAAAMDQLVDLTTGASVQGLRELSTIASLLTNRFTRLIQYGRSVPDPGSSTGDFGSTESPPLINFVAALQLFVDAFTDGGSSRLLYLARPPILAYGLYTTGDNEPANRLVRLVIARGNLASAIDCFAGCGCDADGIRCIVVLDFILSMLDRAVDLYAVGTSDDGDGEVEMRAIAAGLLAKRAIRFLGPPVANDIDADILFSCTLPAAVVSAVDAVFDVLVTSFGALTPDSKAIAASELRIAYSAELQTESLVRRLAAGCADDDVFSPHIGEGAEFYDSIVRLLIRRTSVPLNAGAIELGSKIAIPPTSSQALAMMSRNVPHMIQPESNFGAQS